MPVNKTIPFYDGMAEQYDKIIIKAGYEIAEKIYEWMKPHLDSSPGNLLDLGIGTGLASINFARAGWKITGIDGSPKMLQEVQRKQICTRVVNADLSQGEIPLVDTKFDAILCIGLFEFVIDSSNFFQNIGRLAQDGACFAIAIRDYALNPQFTSMDYDGQKIDRSAYEEHNVIAVHHPWNSVIEELTKNRFLLLEEKTVFAYRSPTQGFDTMNRIVFARYQGS